MRLAHLYNQSSFLRRTLSVIHVKFITRQLPVACFSDDSKTQATWKIVLRLLSKRFKCDTMEADKENNLQLNMEIEPT